MKTQRRKRRSTSNNDAPIATSESLKAWEQQVISIAEQLGRLAGAVQAKANHWLEQPAFQSQLASIRDRASQLLGRSHMYTQASRHEQQLAVRTRSREKVAAPGKKHRGAPQRRRGVKHSDQKITKAVAAQRRKSLRSRQG